MRVASTRIVPHLEADPNVPEGQPNVQNASVEYYFRFALESDVEVATARLQANDPSFVLGLQDAIEAYIASRS